MLANRRMNTFYTVDKDNLSPLLENIDDYPQGIVIPVDKPYRWTSADVVRKVKFIAQKHFHKKNLKVDSVKTEDHAIYGNSGIDLYAIHVYSCILTSVPSYSTTLAAPVPAFDTGTTTNCLSASIPGNSP